MDIKKSQQQSIFKDDDFDYEKFFAKERLNDTHNFAPASPDEKTLYGASRPGYPKHSNIGPDEIDTWIGFMKGKGISKVVCLLPQDENEDYYTVDLIDKYKKAFGANNVLHAPVGDFERVGLSKLLFKIFPFIEKADKAGQKVVVHCSAGIGRTGQVLWEWLKHYRHMKPDEALAAVQKSGRNPLERFAMKRSKVSPNFSWKPTGRKL